MKINLLSIEMSYYLCSVSLKISNTFFYKEFLNNKTSIKNMLHILDLILIENNLSYRDLDFITFSDFCTSLTNAKSILIIALSLSFIWKIPLIKISSLLPISFESFLTHKKDTIVMLTDNKKIEVYCCKCIYIAGILSFYSYKFKSFNSINIIELKDFILIVNSIELKKKLSKKYKGLKIKFFLTSKAIYTNIISEYFILKNYLVQQNKIQLSYSNILNYKKYNFLPN